MIPEHSKGFTLVELLVVISIIAILATIGYTIYSNAQKSVRDGKRKADIQAIHQALEQSRSQSTTYPSVATQSCNPTGITGNPNCPTTDTGDAAQWTTAVGGGSLYGGGTAPKDPLNKRDTINYTYYYNGAGSICIWRLEVNSPAVSGVSDFCISPQQ